MELRDYPRPKGDTGIGVHWNAGFPSAVGLGRIQDFWLPELFALGVKWVKLSRHDGGLELAGLLLKNDIMPIVRLYRFHPNPGTLDDNALAAVKDYVAAGVRYFEFNNEPDLGVEWQSTEVPPDAQQIVARNAIVDIEAILKLGGYPAIPALAPGTKWDLVGEICKLGRRDLLAEPVWQALHNYSLNHPLDYPADTGNQAGAAYAEDFYERLATEVWNGNAWGGWSLERVNAERRDHSNPGATAFDDPSCWRAYERYDRLIRDQIGRSLPILATENGYVVDERPDPRYPTTTPQLHAAQTLEACRIMMGASTRFDHAPDYYFCTAFWLLGNYSLGHWAPEWEGQAWYSDRWPGGRLPIVAALKAEPKQARAWRGDGGIAGRVTGQVQNGAGLTVRLVRADGVLGPGWPLAALVTADGRYEFTDLPLAAYRVSLVEIERESSVALTRERPAATANFDLTGIVVNIANSIVRGAVRGGVGMTVGLARPADGWSQQQAVAPDGSYRFAGLPAGSYVAALKGTEIARAGIMLDGRNEAVVDLAVPGWGWEVTDGGPGPGFGVVRCRVKGRPEAAVRLTTLGWQGMVQRTGSKPEYGSDVCEFAPLGAGDYALQAEGIETVAQAKVDGSRVIWVTFSESAAPPALGSAVAGRVRNGAGRTIALTGPGGEQTTQVAADGAYRFEGLAAGIYRVSLPGSDVAQDGIVLDGHNRATVDLALPPQAASVIAGTVAHGAGRTVRLIRQPAADVVAEVKVGQAGDYRFEKLAAGVYSVQVLAAAAGAPLAAERTGLTVDGTNRIQADFALPAPAPTATWSVEDGGPGPGSSVIRCRVIGMPGRPVRLWTSGWSGITQQTGSKAEYGPDACEFAPLGAGVYSLEAADLGITAEVRVEPNRVVWVRFEPPAPAGPTPEPPPTPPTPPTPPEPPPSRSVIAGAVTNGEGLLIVLAGPTGQRQTTVTAGRYRFEGLPAGVYRVAALAADPAPSSHSEPVLNAVKEQALGELAVREGIAVDGTNAVTVDLALPAAAESVIKGRVKGGAGRTIALEGAEGLKKSATVADDEYYSFTDLPAGVYRATALDADPPTGSTQFQAGITLDGMNTVVVDFDLDALGPGKALDHYLLVGSPARSKEDFMAVVRYAARFQPTVGTDEAEARKARHVTILGGSSAVSALVEQGLRLAGCQVQRIESDYAVKLGKLMDEGRAY